jgi:DNA-binding CsgD family transcriptional regulator
LIAAAVRADLRPLARARAHGRAARLLASAGADTGRIAGQLQHTRPAADPWVSATLHAAGRDALGSGEFASAVSLLRRALDEPPPDDERVATLIDLARAEAAADSPQASARLTEALSHIADPAERADTYAELSRLRFFAGDVAGAADAAERGLAELDANDVTARLLLSAYLTAATFDHRLRPGRGDRLARYVQRARDGQADDDPLICAHVGARMAVSGDPAALVAPVVERALSEHPLVDATSHGVVLAFPVVSLVMLDDLDRAEQALAAAAASPQSRGSLIAATVIEHWSAVVAYRRGDLISAHAHAQRAIAACDTDDWRLYDAWINSNLAHVLLELGEPDAAAAALTGIAAVDPIGRCLVLEARAHLAADQGDAAAAYELYTEAGAALDAMGLVSPGFISWRSPAAIAAVHIGRRDDAARLASADLEAALRTGTARSIGIAQRAAAITAASDETITLLSRSVDTLQACAGSLEYARSLIMLGAAQRRNGQRSQARVALEHALDLAARIGAEPLIRHATDELHAAGSRPRRAYRTGLESLTATERRIAELGAVGKTNAEIGRSLYITTKTVEWHLANVYRKLNLANRRQLATAMNDLPVGSG